MKPEEKIRNMSGISKRLFVALSDFRAEPSQLEDSLFQLASVIDSTSKYHMPNERSSKKRFVEYLNSITTDIFRIATVGKITITDCTFSDKDGNQRSFGEIVYGIRCSSYHDPNEVDELIHWGGENQFGVNNNKFIINKMLLMGIFLMLISDEANINHIDTSLFNDDHFLIVNGENYPFHKFVGNRDRIFKVMGI